MPWGVVAGAAIGAIGSVVSGGEQADAQEQAAQTQQNMFNTINGQEQPFVQSGYGATAKLNDLLGVAPLDSSGKPIAGGAAPDKDFGSLTKPFTSADYLANKDPGYDFQLQQGNQALRNASAPTSGALSGAALKDLMSFNQNYAATGYQNAFDRFNTQQGNVFARLSGLAGLGQNAASNVGTAGTSLGTGIAQAQAGAGASRAAGISGAANSASGGALLSAYLGQGSSGGGGGNLNPINAGGNYMSEGDGLDYVNTTAQYLPGG